MAPLYPFAGPYPNTSFGDHELVKRNCEALGLPIPVLAWVAGTGYNTGFTESGRPQAGSRRNVTFNRGGSGSEAVFAQVADIPYPVLSLDGNTTANRASFTPNLYIPGNLTVFAITTNRLQSANRNIVVVGKGDSGGTQTEWFLGGNNHTTGTDYQPRWLVSIGGVVAKIKDTNTWAIGERLILAGVRRGGDIELWRAGIKVATTTCGAGAIDNTGASQIDVGGFYDVGTYNANADTECIYIFDEALTPEQIELLSRDPMCLFGDRENVDLAAALPYDPIKLKSASSSFTLVGVASPASFVFRSIDGATTTALPGGGRQTVRLPNGDLWHVYYTGSAVQAAVSTDGGITWTIYGVVNSAVYGLAMCAGANDRPVIAVSISGGTSFNFYEWSGTAFVYMGVLSNHSHNESFQIVWNGTYYLLAYIEISGGTAVQLRRSTTLASWSTIVMAYGGSGGFSGSTLRMLAMCLDTSDVAHFVFCTKVGGTWNLYYATFNGTTANGLELIATGGMGNNLTDLFSYLSLAIDATGVLHLAGLKQNVTYSSRLNVRYWRRAAGAIQTFPLTSSWTEEVVHADVDASQGAPSLSLNMNTPIICFASAGLGLGIAKFTRGTSWSGTVITANTRDNVQTIHGPGHGSSGRYARGVVGTMHGSEEAFYSTDAIAGTGAVAAGSFTLAAYASTQKRVAYGTFNLTGTATGVRSPTGRSFFSLAGRANLTVNLSPSSGFVLWGHAEEGATSGLAALLRVDSSRFLLRASCTGVKTPNKTATGAFTLSGLAGLSRAMAASSGFGLAGIGACNRIATRGAASLFGLAGLGRINFTLNKPVTSGFTLRGAAVALPIEGCETNFVPSPTIPASEDTITAVYFFGPFGSPVYAIKLPRPEFGDGRKQNLQIVMHHTRGGDRRTFTRTPTYETLSLHFPNLSRKKLLEMRRFIRLTKGVDVSYVDHNGWVWRGLITSPEPDLRTMGFDKSGELDVEFEGEIIQ